ncbi:MAG: hypothetical protein M0R76_13805 [Proteobacteria bacterium]|nr:hypothetical protein [Pseudomonadota bacterium]
MKYLTGISAKLLAAALTLLLVGPVAAGEYTDVIDAADMRMNNNPFDLNIRIGYLREQETGLITRESKNSAVLQPNAKSYYAKYDLASYNIVRNILDLELDIGLFRDVSFRFGVPVILSDDRTLSRKKDWIDGSTPLFETSFHAPQRSGLDYLSAALWWGILEQGRVPEHPYLTVFVEGRFAVGKRLVAACTDDGAVHNDCENDGGDGGISRNINELRTGLRFSRRFGPVEPYSGIEALIGWYKEETRDLTADVLNKMPPLVGTFDFGLEIVPWEVRAEHRKFVIDVGGSASYFSEGRTYTPLFDALGTSRHFRPCDAANPAASCGNADGLPDAVQGDAAEQWTGMTDVEDYASISGRLVLTIQPAKYVKFAAGFNMGYQSAHLITKTDYCPANSVDLLSGICTKPNLGHRPEIDNPGTRFRSEKTLVWSLLLNATAQF